MYETECHEQEIFVCRLGVFCRLAVLR